MDGFANLHDVPLTHGSYRMADHAFGLAMGMSFAAGELRASFGANPEGVRAGDGWGIMGWSPRSVLTASFAPKGANYAIRAAFLNSSRKRPVCVRSTTHTSTPANTPSEPVCCSGRYSRSAKNLKL